MSETDDDAPPGVSWRELTGAGEEDELAARYHAAGPGAGPPVPAPVAPYLKGDERHILAVRQHRSVLIAPAAVLAAGLAGALAASAAARGLAVRGAWWAALAAAGWAAWQWLSWRSGWLVITADRLLVVQGAIGQRVDMLPYARLRDVSMSRSLAGRLLGYGTLHCTSIAAGGALAAITRVPWPDEIYARLCEQIMPPQGKRGPG